MLHASIVLVVLKHVFTLPVKFQYTASIDNDSAINNVVNNVNCHSQLLNFIPTFNLNLI